MAQSDRRVKYTRRVLQEAVLELLKTKSIDSLTVKEICELADVNRGTFYLHYSQPRDILKEIENNFIASHMAVFDDVFDAYAGYGAMDKIFALIEADRELCRILMGENGDPQFLKSLMALCREAVLNEWNKEFPKSPRKGLEFAFDYVFAGATRLILNWIDDDHGLTADQFGKQLERLGHYSLVAVGDFPEAE